MVLRHISTSHLSIDVHLLMYLYEIFGSSEEYHLLDFEKSDVTYDIAVTSWLVDDITCQSS